MLTSSYPSQLHQAAQEHPLALVFVTLGGSHLYGCPSVDSDWDLRGAHVLRLREVLGLGAARESMQFSHVPQPTRRVVPLEEDIKLDLVTQDIRKLAGALLGRNGYALEQVLSPLVLQSSLHHTELSRLARQCVTIYHADHYLGLTVNQWKMLGQEIEAGRPPRLKLVLYAFRTALSGIHLMQTGEIETNLELLNMAARLPYLDDLIAMKQGGLEDDTLNAPLEPYASELQRLLSQLEEDRQSSKLPSEVPAAVRAALNNWVIDTRLELGKEKSSYWQG